MSRPVICDKCGKKVEVNEYKHISKDTLVSLSVQDNPFSPPTVIDFCGYKCAIDWLIQEAPKE